MQNGSLALTNWQARRTPKTISFTYTTPGRKSQSLDVSTTIWNKKAIQTVDLWLSEKEIEPKVVKVISQILNLPAIPFKPDTYTGIVARWDVKKFKTEQLVKLFELIGNT